MSALDLSSPLSTNRTAAVSLSQDIFMVASGGCLAAWQRKHPVRKTICHLTIQPLWWRRQHQASSDPEPLLD